MVTTTRPSCHLKIVVFFFSFLKEAAFKKFWYLTILSDQVVEKQINFKKQRRAE